MDNSGNPVYLTYPNYGPSITGILNKHFEQIVKEEVWKAFQWMLENKVFLRSNLVIPEKLEQVCEASILPHIYYSLDREFKPKQFRPLIHTAAIGFYSRWILVQLAKQGRDKTFIMNYIRVVDEYLGFKILKHANWYEGIVESNYELNVDELETVFAQQGLLSHHLWKTVELNAHEGYPCIFYIDPSDGITKLKPEFVNEHYFPYGGGVNFGCGVTDEEIKATGFNPLYGTPGKEMGLNNFGANMSKVFASNDGTKLGHIDLKRKSEKVFAVEQFREQEDKDALEEMGKNMLNGNYGGMNPNGFFPNQQITPQQMAAFQRQQMILQQQQQQAAFQQRQMMMRQQQMQQQVQPQMTPEQRQAELNEILYNPTGDVATGRKSMQQNSFQQQAAPVQNDLVTVQTGVDGFGQPIYAQVPRSAIVQALQKQVPATPVAPQNQTTFTSNGINQQIDDAWLSTNSNPMNQYADCLVDTSQTGQRHQQPIAQPTSNLTREQMENRASAAMDKVFGAGFVTNVTLPVKPKLKPNEIEIQRFNKFGFTNEVVVKDSPEHYEILESNRRLDEMYGANTPAQEQSLPATSSYVIGGDTALVVPNEPAVVSGGSVTYHELVDPYNPDLEGSYTEQGYRDVMKRIEERSVGRNIDTSITVMEQLRNEFDGDQVYHMRDVGLMESRLWAYVKLNVIETYDDELNAVSSMRHDRHGRQCDIEDAVDEGRVLYFNGYGDQLKHDELQAYFDKLQADEVAKAEERRQQWIKDHPNPPPFPKSRVVETPPEPEPVVEPEPESEEDEGLDPSQWDPHEYIAESIRLDTEWEKAHPEEITNNLRAANSPDILNMDSLINAGRPKHVSTFAPETIPLPEDGKEMVPGIVTLMNEEADRQIAARRARGEPEQTTGIFISDALRETHPNDLPSTPKQTYVDPVLQREEAEALQAEVRKSNYQTQTFTYNVEAPVKQQVQPARQTAKLPESMRNMMRKDTPSAGFGEIDVETPPSGIVQPGEEYVGPTSGLPTIGYLKQLRGEPFTAEEMKTVAPLEMRHAYLGGGVEVTDEHVRDAELDDGQAQEEEDEFFKILLEKPDDVTEDELKVHQQNKIMRQAYMSEWAKENRADNIHAHAVEREWVAEDTPLPERNTPRVEKVYSSQPPVVDAPVSQDEPMIKQEITDEQIRAAMHANSKVKADLPPDEPIVRPEGSTPAEMVKPTLLDDVKAYADREGTEVAEPRVNMIWNNIPAVLREELCRKYLLTVPAYIEGEEYLVMINPNNEWKIEVRKYMDKDKHVIRNKVASWDSESSNVGYGRSLLNTYKGKDAVEVNDYLETINEIVNAEDGEEADRAMDTIIARTPMVTIEDIVVSNTSPDDYQSDPARVMLDRGMMQKQINSITEQSAVSYTRLNKIAQGLSKDTLDLVNKIVDSATAEEVILRLNEFKSDADLNIRDIARIQHDYNNILNYQIMTVFGNGWAIDDFNLNYETILPQVLLAFNNQFEEEDIVSLLDQCYIAAAVICFNTMEQDNPDADTEEESVSYIGGKLENIILLPIYYSQYPIMSSVGAALLSQDTHPELITLLDQQVLRRHTTITKVVTLDNTVLTFVTQTSGHYLVNVVKSSEQVYAG